MHSTPVPQNEQYVEYTELLFINNIYFFYKTLIVKRFLHLTLVLLHCYGEVRGRFLTGSAPARAPARPAIKY